MSFLDESQFDKNFNRVAKGIGCVTLAYLSFAAGVIVAILILLFRNFG